jgi:hypothetical protein
MTLATLLTKRFSTFAFTSVLALMVGVFATAQARDERLSYAGGSCSQGTMSRLYLGQSTPTGDVTESQWRAFVADAVAPRFPAGFTELKANGHWRDDNGMAIDERTRIVEIAHDGAPATRERIRAIAVDYRQRFAQESVLITQSRTMHCFENKPLASNSH